MTGSAAGPVRTCVGCRRREAQGQLVRVVGQGGAAVVDAARRLSGRGAWLHPRKACFERAGRGELVRALKGKVSVTAADVERLWMALGAPDPEGEGGKAE